MSILDYPHLMSPEQKKVFLKAYKECIPKKSTRVFNFPMILGTGGKINKS